MITYPSSFPRLGHDSTAPLNLNHVRSTGSGAKARPRLDSFSVQAEDKAKNLCCLPTAFYKVSGFWQVFGHSLVRCRSQRFSQFSVAHSRSPITPDNSRKLSGQIIFSNSSPATQSICAKEGVISSPFKFLATFDYSCTEWF